ncbi:MAG TPA: hypothetical protein VF840_02665 [Terriglobales bacterium]
MEVSVRSSALNKGLNSVGVLHPKTCGRSLRGTNLPPAEIPAPLLGRAMGSPETADYTAGARLQAPGFRRKAKGAQLQRGHFQLPAKPNRKSPITNHKWVTSPDSGIPSVIVPVSPVIYSRHR